MTFIVNMFSFVRGIYKIEVRCQIFWFGTINHRFRIDRGSLQGRFLHTNISQKRMGSFIIVELGEGKSRGRGRF